MPADVLPIAAVMMHVPDWRAALEWYARAFPAARVGMTDRATWGSLEIDGIRLEFVPADEKVASGPAGTVVYWFADDFDDRLEHLREVGAVLYRGPLEIEDGWVMCQMKDPFGNLIGIRGPRRRDRGTVRG